LPSRISSRNLFPLRAFSSLGFFCIVWCYQIMRPTEMMAFSDTQDERRIVTEFRSPLTWFSCASESCRLEGVGNVWLVSSPFVLGFSRDHRVFHL
jgi:hypothetical protein